MNLPETISPEELAQHMGWSPRRVKALARKLAACRIMGNRMALTQADVDVILEASRPCPSNSKSAVKSGTTPAPLPGGDYEALRKLRNAKRPSILRTKSKAENSKVVAIRALS